MPWEAVPSAKPRRAMPSASVGRRIRPNSQRADKAPTMPVSAANTAASAGTPPICAATPIATGAVTDLGARDISTSPGRPSAQPSPTALAAAAVPPAREASTSRPQRARSAARRCHSGQPKATTAGPSKKWMNCAPAK